MPEPAAVEDLFLAALDRPPADRDAFVEAACAGDPDRLRRVRELLAAHHRSRGPLDSPPLEGPTTAMPPTIERSGAAIGRYRLIEPIGEGGMGEVWLAQQQEPVKRVVALKVIKAGLDSRQVLARFEAERQALALMDHPHIAKVLDAGATSEGRPYFVMELVKGTPITKYCDEHRLTPKHRLELFVQVCQAVQHAHQKGIIHRDIKPSNVLVAPYDGVPVVKVIDFGVAKAAGPSLTDKTLVTGLGAVVGTPEYMSPEQAELNNADIDTRSDVYALGVLLYELLTGTTPLTRGRVKEAALLEVLRVIREEEPPRPSDRLSTTAELPSIAAVRGVEPARLSKLVRGDLDWIVMKALEKDRSRRYETAAGFALDVQRYLADEPVLAGPPGAGYRLRKFVRRNKAGVAVTGLVVFVLALVAVGGGWVAYDRAARRAKVGNDFERASERAGLFLEQGKRADARAAFSEADRLAGDLSSDPTRDRRLADLKERLEAQERDQDLHAWLDNLRLDAQSQVRLEQSRFAREFTFSDIRKGLHEYGIDVGILPPEQAVALIQSRPQPVQEDLVAALEECLSLAPKGEVGALKWLRAVLSSADNDPWRARVRQAWMDSNWSALEQLTREADVLRHPVSFLLNVAQSLPTSMKAARLEFFQRIQQAYPGDLWANCFLATELQDNGRTAEAVRYHTAAVALRPSNPGFYANRAIALERAGELEAATADCERALALSPGYFWVHNNLGQILAKRQRNEAAIAHYREFLRHKPDFATAHTNLGALLFRQNKLEEAIAEHREAIRLGKDLPEAHYNLGNALIKKGDLDGAIAEHGEAIRLREDYAEAHLFRGQALALQGKVDDAIVEFRNTLAIRKDDATAHKLLGDAFHDKHRLNEATAEYREATRIQKDFEDAHFGLGNVLYDLKRLDDAIASYREVIRIQNNHVGAHTNLGNALFLKDAIDDAIASYRTAIKLKDDSHEAHFGLGNALKEKGDVAGAVAEYRKAIQIKPDYSDAHIQLGFALLPERPDEAVAALRRAIEIKPASVEAHQGLGDAWHAKRDLPRATAEYRAAIRLKKDHADAYYGLANALAEQGQLKDAIATYRDGIGLKPAPPEPHYSLGVLLAMTGDPKGAVAEFRTAIKLRNDFPQAHTNLGLVQLQMDQFEDAITEFREALRTKIAFAEAYIAHAGLGDALTAAGRRTDARTAYVDAIRLKADYAPAYYGLGNVYFPDRLKEAIDAYRKAIKLNPNDAQYHNNLGNALAVGGDLDGAIPEFQKAIALKKDLPEPHHNLGRALQEKGRFKEAVAEYRVAVDLQKDNAEWREHLREAEQMARLDERLPAVVAGTDKPGDAAETLTFAHLCQLPYHKQYAAAARLFAEAFTADPKRAERLETQHRYNAACSAALAAAGQGKDASKLDDKDRARLRQQALDWLRADLAAWGRVLEKEPQNAPMAVEILRHWLDDTDFAAVRGREALDKLPEAERRAWQKLWDDAAAMLKRAGEKKNPEPK